MTLSTAAVKATQSAVAEIQLPFAVTGQAAEAWLQRLPSLGFGEGCRQLFNALRAVNRIDMAAHQRFQLLELLRPQVLEFSRRFEPYFMDQSFPLDDKIAKVVRLAVQFQTELARGYQRVAGSSACAEAFSPIQQATAVHRALTAYGLYLLRSAQSHEAPVANVWQKIYSVYSRAESLHVADVAVTDCGLSSSATVSECLRKISLFQLALPTRLPQRVVGQLFAWFDEKAHLVGLHRERAFNLQEAHFSLDLTGNAMPQPIGALTLPHAKIRYLFLEPLLLELLESGSACAAFGLMVAKRFNPGTEGWNSTGQNWPVLFACGAEGCAALLAADSTTVKQRLNGLKSNDKPLELQIKPYDTRERLSVRVTHSFESTQNKPPQISRAEIWGVSALETTAVNHSGQGLMRFYDNDSRAVLTADRQRLQVGAVVVMTGLGIEHAIGIIRAVTPTADATRAFADVEILGGTLTTAYAYLEGEKKRRLPCLLLGGEPGSAGTAILPSTTFANGTWLTLEQDGKWTNRRLARLLESTENFNQYQLLA